MNNIEKYRGQFLQGSPKKIELGEKKSKVELPRITFKPQGLVLVHRGQQ